MINWFNSMYIYNCRKYKPTSLIKYNIDLEPEEIIKYIDYPENYNFMSKEKYTNTISWDNTISCNCDYPDMNCIDEINCSGLNEVYEDLNNNGSYDDGDFWDSSSWLDDGDGVPDIDEFSSWEDTYPYGNNEYNSNDLGDVLLDALFRVAGI